MNILFFDMEFANGRVPGSIYSIGYLMTDEYFKPIIPPSDLLINPDCAWNEYVKANILAYPIELVEAAPTFDKRYEELKDLFARADVAVGFALGNDNTALFKACERYGLPMPVYRFADMESLCKKMDVHSEARGLKGCVTAWCGHEPKDQHRSDGDAYATMLLMKAICRHAHVNAEMLLMAYPDCCGNSLTRTLKKKKMPKVRFFKKKRRPARKSEPADRKQAEEKKASDA